MADAPAKPHGGLESLTKKVGPLPVWAYAVIAVGVWYWYTHYGPGANKAAPAQVGASGTGSPGGIGSNEITTTLYPDDAAWAQAAITYLGGIGIPQGQATFEIDNYLTGKPNTAQGQADVQLALNGIGPPPVNAPAVPSSGGKPPAGGGGKPHREVSVGVESLDQVAKVRDTTVAWIEQVTRGAATPAELAAFNKYVAGGTSKPMPPGLVYYTTSGGTWGDTTPVGPGVTGSPHPRRKPPTGPPIPVDQPPGHPVPPAAPLPQHPIPVDQPPGVPPASPVPQPGHDREAA